VRVEEIREMHRLANVVLTSGKWLVRARGMSDDWKTGLGWAKRVQPIAKDIDRGELLMLFPAM
jgi:hypothetical protein